jgi:hypothetical protein
VRRTYTNANAIAALRPGKSFTWYEEGNKVEWVDSDVTTPTDSEITAKLKELNDAEPMRLLREKRDKLLAETDWWASSDLTMTSARTTYRQALRDLPSNQGDKASIDDNGLLTGVTWPTKPE